MLTPLRNTPLPIFFILIAGVGASAQAPADDILDVFDRASNHDAVLRAELAERDVASQGVELAAADRRPQLDLSASASVNDVDTRDVDSWEESSISLNAVQPLYNRVTSKSLDRAGFDVDAAEARLLDAQQQLVLRVASAYFGVLRAQSSLEVSDAELEAIDRQRVQVRQQFEVGLVPDTAVLEADAQFDLADARRIVVVNELFEARQTLLTIAGHIDEPLQTLSDVEPMVWLDDMAEEDWVERALTANPLLTQSEAELQSLQTGIDVRRAERYPTLNLVGSASMNRTDQLDMDDNDLASIGIELGFSLYGGGLVTAQVAQASAQATAARERLLDQRRALALQSKVAYRSLRSSVQQVQANERALRSNQALYDSVDAAFRAGSGTLVDVLDATQDLFSARFDYVNSRFSLITDFLNLEATAGQLNRDDLVTLNQYLEPGGNP